MSHKITTFILAVIAIAASLSASAQEAADTVYRFRFVAADDMFYSPWSGNGEELDRLAAAIQTNREAIDNGQMYLSVTSYGTRGSDGQTADEVARLRRLRVKSELILRTGIKEENFVTDREEPASPDGSRDIVIVILPSPLDKVAAIAGDEAAARVRAYNNRGQEEQAAREREAAAARERAEREARERAERERAEAQRAAQEREAAEQAARERAEAERLAAAQQKKAPYTIALRTNLLRLATLTPDLGIEWRISRHAGILVNGTWTTWSWNGGDRRYALKELNPEVRWYMGHEKRAYIGAMYKVGDFNYKLSHTGKQGDIMGGGITGGVQLELSKAFSLDLSLGLGYVHADYDKYVLDHGVRVKSGEDTTNWVGPIQAGVSLVWKL